MTIQSPSSSRSLTEYCQPDESTFLVGFNQVSTLHCILLIVISAATERPQNLSSPATPCSYTIHHVQPDDTLERIALKHNCSVSSLARANKLWSPNALFMKQFIRIPIFVTQSSTPQSLPTFTKPQSLESSNRKKEKTTTERVDNEKSMKDILRRIDENIKNFSET
uniref:LysM domain-containing protein n=1 Tax=Caenorhabditis japonica TaxID=281687 RepID=A0A8R1E3M4_CAEJA